MAKMFFSVFLYISRMHKRVFKKKIRFRHIFATKLSFKVPSPATPNKDDRELLSLGPEQAVTSLQESSTLQPVYFNLSLYFHTNSIIFRIIYAKKWLILYGKTMKH